jgi:NitT/TauT family transport system permease protein
MKIKFLEWLYLPNVKPKNSIMWAIIAVEFVLGIVVWQNQPFELIPKPLEVFAAYPALLKQGLVYHLMMSFLMFLEALGIATVFSLFFAYLSRFAAGYPIASFVGLLRFLGMTGLTFLFQIMLGGGHALKLSMLVFGITVFYTVGMVSVVQKIPEEEFDHARTLKMGEWHVLYEVVILGTIDKAFDLLKQNSAMGWMMLSMVEGLVRSEGGIGTLLLNNDKHFDMSSVYAIQFAILATGITIQLIGSGIERAVCKWEVSK